MNVVAWIVAGIIMGWLANRVMNDGETHGRIGYLAVGVLGAFVGVQLLSPMFGPPAADPNAFSITLLISAAIGASLCLFFGTMILRKFFP
ncbi:MAG: GlsB/YeaQ/YmgE family stress response membrane protein [Betaproteobacteria bacterium]|nr:GlsB/YeaQ/YmgE family stress response membrane protein [Betaproteobacteria bacterium]